MTDPALSNRMVNFMKSPPLITSRTSRSTRWLCPAPAPPACPLAGPPRPPAWPPAPASTTAAPPFPDALLDPATRSSRFGTARFDSATFEDTARFDSATFRNEARFGQAVFERAASLGPLVCAGQVVLSGAVFGGPVTFSFAAHRLECRRTRWSSAAEVRLRYATVDFAHAVFEYPSPSPQKPPPSCSPTDSR